MYALKRILAYGIDVVLVMFLASAASPFLFEIIGMNAPLGPLTGMLSSYASMGVTAGIPVMLLGTLSGAFGWTPGKLIFSLRVVNRHGKPPGVAQGILRELVKYIGLCFGFLGAFWALYGIVTTQLAFYDDWIGTEVDDLRGSGLTETQKNWRKFQRENRS